jgi:hypothetical protein
VYVPAEPENKIECASKRQQKMTVLLPLSTCRHFLSMSPTTLWQAAAELVGTSDNYIQSQSSEH